MASHRIASLVDLSSKDSSINMDDDQGRSCFSSFLGHRSLCEDRLDAMWEITIDGQFNDGRTFFIESNGSLDRVKETTAKGGLADEKISPGKIDGWGEWQ